MRKVEFLRRNLKLEAEEKDGRKNTHQNYGICVCLADREEDRRSVCIDLSNPRVLKEENSWPIRVYRALQDTGIVKMCCRGDRE